MNPFVGTWVHLSISLSSVHSHKEYYLSLQIIVLLILPNSIASSGANYAKNLLRAAVLVQYIPRLYRFLPLLAGQSPSGFIFESAWANFVINLLTFVLAGHVVGACWYLFGLQVPENHEFFLCAHKVGRLFLIVFTLTI